MTDKGKDSRSFGPFGEILLFACLLVLGISFFGLVRNNGFWHSSDYGFLRQAIRIDSNWREIFSPEPHDTFQPLVNWIFYLEFRFFDTTAWYYYLFNIVVHCFNAYLVYVLVRTLLHDRTIALLSSILFVFAVGNYGKAVMVVSGISDLIITMLTLLTMIFFVRNELHDSGRQRSLNFFLCLLFFLLSLLSKATSFSLLGCMLAFNMFFRQQKRRVLAPNFLTIAAFAFVVLVIKLAVLRSIPAAADIVIVSWSFPKNFAAYLVRMVLPIQYSAIVRDSGPIIQFVYRFTSELRLIIFLCIVSYSIFGFIFGNRTIRFFIAWTYITVAPFCFFRFPTDWLNIRFLYLVSVGFCMILASGTVLAARLLYQKEWRRILPFLIPVFFVFLSRFVVGQLDGNYEDKERSRALDTARQTFMLEYREHRSRR